jgi:hypothetical protein
MIRQGMNYLQLPNQLETLRAAISPFTANTESERNKFHSKFHLTEIPVPFSRCRAECTDHIGARRVTTIYIGRFFGCIRTKSFLLY